MPRSDGQGSIGTPLPASFQGFDLVRAAGWATASRLSVYDAEQLLDWLDNHGITDCDCQIQSDGSWTVRWNESAALVMETLSSSVKAVAAAG